MKLSLLVEFNFAPLMTPPDRATPAAPGHGNEQSKMRDFPSRSGSLLTPPPKLDHRSLVGHPLGQQSTMSKSLKQQRDTHRSVPFGTNSMLSLGDPFQRGIVNASVGDDASKHDIDAKDPPRPGLK